MDGGSWAFIVIELGLVFGAAMAFAWWQFRDLARERQKRQARQAREATTETPDAKQ
jgi:hypothetical protein